MPCDLGQHGRLGGDHGLNAALAKLGLGPVPWGRARLQLTSALFHTRWSGSGHRVLGLSRGRWIGSRRVGLRRRAALWRVSSARDRARASERRRRAGLPLRGVRGRSGITLDEPRPPPPLLCRAVAGSTCRGAPGGLLPLQCLSRLPDLPGMGEARSGPCSGRRGAAGTGSKRNGESERVGGSAPPARR